MFTLVLMVRVIKIFASENIVNLKGEHFNYAEEIYRLVVVKIKLIEGKVPSHWLFFFSIGEIRVA